MSASRTRSTGAARRRRTCATARYYVGLAGPDPRFGRRDRPDGVLGRRRARSRLGRGERVPAGQSAADPARADPEGAGGGARTRAACSFNAELIELEQDADGVTARCGTRRRRASTPCARSTCSACDGGRTVGRRAGRRARRPARRHAHRVGVHDARTCRAGRGIRDVLIRWLWVPRRGKLGDARADGAGPLGPAVGGVGVPPRTTRPTNARARATSASVPT